MSGLLELYEENKPLTAKADLKGGDKTLIEADGGLDLSKDEAALKKARGGEIGQGTPRGYAPGKGYSSTKRE
jgi:hypothetical protein